MSGVVVDASVVIKQLIQEELSDHAHELFEQALLGSEPLVGPTLLPSEVTNVLFQRSRRVEHSITVEEAEAALDLFLLLPIRIVDSVDLYRRAFRFARANNLRATYDSVYVVLAQDLKATLWTADRRLVNVLHTSAPWVRWIGDFPVAA
jgi:predicted nucleic acid-binding protein